MLPALKKPEINPILRSKLLGLDLDCPIDENYCRSEKATICLRIKDKTAVILALDKNSDPKELKARIRYIVNTPHVLPNCAINIADALCGFLHCRGLDNNFSIILATPDLKIDTNLRADSEREKSRLPSMPVKIEPDTALTSKPLAVACMPNHEESRAEYLNQRTIDFGSPKNSNFRRKKFLGVF